MEVNLSLLILGIIVDFVEKNTEGRSNRWVNAGKL